MKRFLALALGVWPSAQTSYEMHRNLLASDEP